MTKISKLFDSSYSPSILHVNTEKASSLQNKQNFCLSRSLQFNSFPGVLLSKKCELILLVKYKSKNIEDFKLQTLQLQQSVQSGQRSNWKINY